MYVNGLGFRAIERITGVNHNTLIRWGKKSAMALADVPEISEIPEITEIDELQTLVGKKNKKWL
jgi:insertion element IS1 protein InsB